MRELNIPLQLCAKMGIKDIPVSIVQEMFAGMLAIVCTHFDHADHMVDFWDAWTKTD
jgi:hypothetical protein